MKNTQYIIVFFIALLLAGGIFFILKNQAAPTESEVPLQQIFTSDLYGFTFTVPEGYEFKEYAEESISIGHTLVPDGFESVADVRVYGAGEEAGYTSYDDFVFNTLHNMCAADGPSESIYCDTVDTKEPFVNAQNLQGEIVYLHRVHEDLQTHEKSEERFGPIYVFNIAANAPRSAFSILAVEPPMNSPVDAINSVQIRAIAESIEINKVTASHEGWKEVTSAESGIAFFYPEALPTFYIEAVDWPPSIQKLDTPYTCTEAGETTARAGRTEERTVNGTVYCITEESEGAAGSIYDQFAYIFEKDGAVYALSFTIRMVQCANFDESQQLACENERTGFNMDDLVDQIVGTIVRL